MIRNLFRATALFWATAGLLALSIVLGGGTHAGFLGDVALQIIAIPVLFGSLLQMGKADAKRVFDPLLVVFLLVLAITIAIQLIPLPPPLQPATELNQLIRSGDLLAGIERGWRSLSVAPSNTWEAVASLLPPFAVFLGVAMLGSADRRMLVNVILAVGGLSLFIGVLQVIQGASSPLRLFEITNPSEAVGFFANRNHLASLLIVVLAFATAWIAWSAASPLSTRTGKLNGPVVVQLAASTLFLLVLFLGLALTRSRAGLVLAGLAVLAVGIPVIVSRWRRREARASGQSILAWSLLVAFLVGSVWGFERVSARLGTDLTTDLRWPLAQTTMEQLFANFPLGTGFGSFVSVYAAAEKTADMHMAYGNRAHNDLLEFPLETGLAGAVLMVVFLAWVIHRFYGVWSGDASRFDQYAARAAAVAIIAVLLHSLVDYPLRTTAMATLFAACLALMIPPDRRLADEDVWPEEEERSRKRKPHRAKRRETPLLRPKPMLVDPDSQPQWPDAWTNGGPRQP